MNLTPDQRSALDNILAFIRSPVKTRDDVAATLYAAAGCGKTFLTRVIVNNVRGSHRVVGVAPTHKARKVLASFLNAGSLLTVKTMTIASLLSRMRSHSYIGTKRYEQGCDTKMHMFDLFLIDEASMITDKDVELIINYAHKLKRKILFIGDKYQIPNPSQRYICNNGIATKKDSDAFSIPLRFGLTTNMRQAENNPIVNLYTEFRDAIAEKREPKINRKSMMNGTCGVQFFSDQDKWSAAVQNIFGTTDKDDIHNVRILAYTNDTVRNHNLMIRRLFKYGSTPQHGELLMGYNNLGWPEKIIENSQDYYVADTRHVTTHRVSPEDSLVFSNLVGEVLDIKETDSSIHSTIFIPDLTAPENNAMLKELVKRAENVNKRKSTKDDFKKYCRLKNHLVFMENVYKHNGDVIGENEFRLSNPLLFKSVKDVIESNDDDRVVLDNKLSQDIRHKYGAILDERIDDDKPLSGTEKLCDRYCVIERDIDYGYCITAHKSQGSNFKIVFVDEADFDKLSDYWSYDLNNRVESTKERNQLKYVAYTRPTTAAYVYYRT